MSLLTVNNLKVHYPIRGGILRRKIDVVRAVDGITMELERGETYGLVGESGSGKSTSGRAIIGLESPTAGEVTFEGQKLNQLKRQDRREYYKDIQMVFQDPYSSLNPKKRVNDIIAEPIRNFEKRTKDDERRRIQELLELVGLSPESMHKYPHEFSGGQKQRLGVARALALQPKLIIADEPVSALDVSVQAQVLNFMKEIQRELDLTYIFISHDLGVVRHMCNRIGIMYNGRFVEEGSAEDVYDNPQHIYTKRLVAAIPDIDPANRKHQTDFRREVKKEYDNKKAEFFDEHGGVFDLKQVSSTHYAALP
ncbi:peptide/nickel transport system ATP-binding protein [Salsuginibacillus halophilus]|uniref:Peptide/nickel transport system ATP-binding protein n=1 Tax=Salsuginibacillus halophilus TaxID=517424 RepID=A0A2P8HI43_9BACI|nr:ATP-binding cassette domain-containing protein [Salsuginibacillus halophilus]PSL45885.1 peptide/nickel transport system ATP-binding protein [Salsuginibacillus halophilus]